MDHNICKILSHTVLPYVTIATKKVFYPGHYLTGLSISPSLLDSWRFSNTL